MTKNNTDINPGIAELLNDASINRVMAIDTSWKIIAWNKTSEEASGYSKKSMIAQPLFDVFPRLKKDAEMVTAFENGMLGRKSFLPAAPSLFNRDFYENHFIPLKTREGIIVGVINIMQDVSNTIKAEKKLNMLKTELNLKLRQVEKANAELVAFSKLTSSDIKEPVRNVYTALELLVRSEGEKFSNAGKATLRRAQATLNRISLVLDDIVSLSNAGSLCKEFFEVDLSVVLEEVLTEMNKKITEKNAVIKAGILPTVYGSKEMIKFLFYNLIDNGLKFQQAGNIPRISITVLQVSLPEHGNENEGTMKDYTSITFSDNGLGFEPQDAEKIFNMFEKLHPRREFSGAGIGLTICSKITEAHGGYIKAEGMPGKGATISCYLSGSPENYRVK